MKLSSALAAVAPALLAAAADVSSHNPGFGLQYLLSIPDATYSAGNGDIFMQLKAPTSYSWAALGMGFEMKNSQIFVMYQDGNGNVTVSPRLGVGEVMPRFNPTAKIELLGGTGVIDDMMVANVKCSDCAKWQGGSIDFSQPSQSFIYAYREGPSLDSTSETATLVQHQKNGVPFTFSLTEAKNNNDVNPFASANVPASGNSGSSGDLASPTTYTDNTGPMVHGIIMGLCVAVLFPLGAIIMAALHISATTWMHAAWQSVTLLLFTAGFGIGVDLAGRQGIRYTGPGKTHTVFGTVLWVLFAIQPFLGLVHHFMFKKRGSRSAVTYAHIVLGRVLIVCSIVNGGLGLQLAADTTGGEIAYGVVAAVLALAYFALAFLADLRRMRGSRGANADRAAKRPDSGSETAEAKH